MQIKMVPGDSAGTVTAYYVIIFFSISFIFLLHINLHFVFQSFLKRTLNSNVLCLSFSCLHKTTNTTRSISSSWGTGQDSHTFCRPMCSREERGIGSRGFSSSSTLLQLTTPMPSSGISTRLCKFSLFRPLSRYLFCFFFDFFNPVTPLKTLEQSCFWVGN